MNRSFHFLLCALFLCTFTYLSAQEEDSSPLNAANFSGMEFRSIGPAFASGRIADIAIHPDDENTWYVAVGSGGVWKTTNAGTTWMPIFDGQAVYSIGCITIDPNNPSTIWVGTGENIGGRHVSFGDGIYRSRDGGKSWTNMGLTESQHISKIIVHPDNSDVLWVAAQGPLWNSGDERGLYKSTDGGETWTKTLGDDEWTGVTDILIDPRNPDLLYAATWDRHRNVAAYMGGGPGSGIHRSTDGGETWEELKGGLPGSNMGKIGLAISPQQPDVLYAAIELDRRTGGIYRSTDRGSSWSKMSDAVSGATGPHYYQELYASPHAFDRIYLVDVRIQVSDDGGRTVRRLSERHKHSDNHAIAFKMDDPDYLMIGTDGGIYESFDLAQTWRFIDNLPITQYYKVAVDDAEPFYNVYGGTQDVNTHGGPSRTDNVHGIVNGDWFITLFGDGHQPATEPGNPDIMYSEWQQGNLCRIDRTTGEIVYIQPQPAAGEDYERFNWDAPILVSPHNPTRLYFASQRVWRSDNRGDSWTAISEDLTRDEDRITFPIMGQTWSWDAPWDVLAMSNYNTITSLAESPLQEGLIYAGTDDGLLQVTENGGGDWRTIEVGSISGVPSTAFVNDIKADLHDANTVYVALDNHKFGDLSPYLIKSTDRGQTWSSISSTLPEKTLVWRIVQDHVSANLLFLATEFGIFFTVDAGENWVQMKGGLPTISFRDLAIQRRENDLVGASFGRSFYILDDYAPLREVTEEQLEQEATLFATRKAWWYVPRPIVGFGGKGNQGASYYVADNPPFGAVFTYFLSEGLTTDKQTRRKAEGELAEDGEDIPFPGWDALEAERRQEAPKIWLTVRDASGSVVRRLSGPTSQGIHRVDWDLSYPNNSAMSLNASGNANEQSSFMAAPGEFTVQLSKEVDGEITALSEPMAFTVERLREGALTGVGPEAVAAFWRETEDVFRDMSITDASLENAMTRVSAMRNALARSTSEPGDLDSRLANVRGMLLDLEERLDGNQTKQEIGEKVNPTVGSRLGAVFTGVSRSTYGPTPNLRQSLDIAKDELATIKRELATIVNREIPGLEQALMEAGAPWIHGQALPRE